MWSKTIGAATIAIYCPDRLRSSAACLRAPLKSSSSGPLVTLLASTSARNGARISSALRRRDEWEENERFTKSSRNDDKSRPVCAATSAMASAVSFGNSNDTFMLKLVADSNVSTYHKIPLSVLHLLHVKSSRVEVLPLPIWPPFAKPYQENRVPHLDELPVPDKRRRKW